MSEPTVYVGVDVSKQSLDVFCNGKPLKVANTTSGHEKLLTWLKQQASTLHVVCEATGGYEKALVTFMATHKIPVSIVEPARVRFYAKSANIRAKTDAIDAALIARFAQAMQPAAYTPPSPTQAKLDELVTLRLQHQEKLLEANNQLATLLNPAVRKRHAKLVNFLEKEIKAIDAEMEKLVNQDQNLKKTFDSITRVKGVASLTAFYLLAYLPELGSLSKKQAASLAGLAPFNKDSGDSSGKRVIKGGRHKLRKSLYMATISAITHDPILNAFYKRLIQAGKPAKVAIVACMRKLLLLLNSLAKNPNFKLAY